MNPEQRTTCSGQTLRRAGMIVISFLASPLIVGSLVQGSTAAPGREPVAQVNDHPILRRDFDIAIQMQFTGRRTGAVGLAELAAMRDRVLEKLIDSELIYQHAVARGYTVSREDVETELGSLRDGFESGEALETLLSEIDMTLDDFLEQIRRSLVVRRFVDEVLLGKIDLTDEILRRYYDQNPAEMRRREAVSIRQIVIRIVPGASQSTRAVAREKIEAILKKVQAGEDFGELAGKYSEGPGAERGGDVGVVVRGGGAPPAIVRAAFQLEAGEVSDIVETRFGLHILLAGERMPGGPIPFEDAREAIRARVVAVEREAAIGQLVESLRDKARVEILIEPLARPE